MNTKVNLKEELNTYFKEKKTEKEAVLTIISTYKLSIDELTLIKKIFAIPTHFKIINIIDTKILGGLIFKFGSKVIDLSIANRLKNLKKLTESM